MITLRIGEKSTMHKKYKILFCGDLSQNNGPANVNKELKKYANFGFIDTKAKNKVKMVLSFIFNMIFYKIIIFSSLYRTNYIFFKMAKIFNKNTVYLMHGYTNFDVRINKETNYKKINKMENYMLAKSDLIIVVSKKYMELVLKDMKDYEYKMHYVLSGLDFQKKDKNRRSRFQNNTIAVCGGNRIIKRNKVVCDAVNYLNNKGTNCNLFVYGLNYTNSEDLINNNNIKVVGRVPQKELFKNLCKTKLFVLNSDYESFGLSVVDALTCGCDILITENSGISSILNLEEMDIIHDNKSIEEISRKIEYNLKNSNNERILNSIDFNHYSWKNVSLRLETVIISFFSGHDFKKIK